MRLAEPKAGYWQAFVSIIEQQFLCVRLLNIYIRGSGDVDIYRTSAIVVARKCIIDDFYHG